LKFTAAATRRSTAPIGAMRVAIWWCTNSSMPIAAIAWRTSSASQPTETTGSSSATDCRSRDSFMLVPPQL
jgi:hypothetical protein